MCISLLFAYVNAYRGLALSSRRSSRLHQTFQEYLNSINQNNPAASKTISDSASTTSKTISDSDFENLLLDGDDAVPKVKTTSSSSSSGSGSGNSEIVKDNKGSGVSDLFTVATTILAKTKVQDLRDLIKKYNVSKLPDEKADCETHISMALDATWTAAGDWDALITLLNKEIGDTAEKNNEFLKKAVLAASLLTLDKIKDLIIKYKDKNAIPKINKEKYTGKLLKGDYLATLIDILREDNLNDYEKVFNIMTIETSKAGAKTDKKGFGEKGSGGKK